LNTEIISSVFSCKHDRHVIRYATVLITVLAINLSMLQAQSGPPAPEEEKKATPPADEAKKDKPKTEKKTTTQPATSKTKRTSKVRNPKIPAPTVQLEEGQVPEITFEEKVFKFTQAEPGKPIFHDYIFTNTGTGPLEILLIKPSCGCTTTGEYDKIIQPGEKGKIPIKLTIKKRRGKVQKNVLVFTNSENNKKVLLKITGDMWEPFQLTPNPLIIAADTKEPTFYIVEFINFEEKPVELKNVEVTDERINATIDVLKPGFEYSIRLTPPVGYKLPTKPVQLILTTDNEKNTTFTVPIRTRTTPRRAGKPGMKLVGKKAPTVSLKTVDGKDVKIGQANDEVIVLEFYTTWCGFCRRSLPHVEEVSKKFKDQTVRFIGVCLDDRNGKRGRTEEQALKHFKQLKLTFEQAFDPQKKAGRPFRVSSFPSLYVIDQNGKVDTAYFGAKRNLIQSLTADLERLLNKTQSSSAAKTKPQAEPDRG